MAMIEKISAVLGLVGTIAGGVYVIEGRYETREQAQEVHAGLQLQYNIGREDGLERRIFDLEVQKRKMGAQWPSFMEQELKRLKTELDRVKENIRKYSK